MRLDDPELAGVYLAIKLGILNKRVSWDCDRVEKRLNKTIDILRTIADYEVEKERAERYRLLEEIAAKVVKKRNSSLSRALKVGDYNGDLGTSDFERRILDGRDVILYQPRHDDGLNCLDCRVVEKYVLDDEY